MAGNSGERMHSRGEMVADGIVHAVGLVAGIAGASALVTAAVFRGASPATVSIYGFALIAMFACSAAYNLGVRLRFREMLRRLDHAAIFTMIAGTYTPFTAGVLHGAWAVGLTAAVWGIAGIGIALKLVLAPHGSQPLTTILYIAFGWIGVIAAKPFLAALSPSVLLLVMIGGLVYTAGTIFFALQRLPYQRAIWHAFVVAGAAIHFCAIFDMIAAT